MKTFEHKVAAITGAGSGIGRALALELAARGCQLALADIDANGLAETAALAARTAPQLRISTARVDVAQREAMHDWAARVASEHARINLIFNNAGVALGASIDGMRYEDLEWIMGINFWGVVHGTKAFLPHLKASGDGHVINISSLFGLLATPGSGAYNASKFAVRGFTEALRQELELARLPVSATCVHPGGIRTAIARHARTDASIRELGGDERTASRNFEKFLLTPPERAATVILEAVRRNRRRVLIGRDAWLFDKLQRLLPAGYQRIATQAIKRSMAGN